MSLETSIAPNVVFAQGENWYSYRIGETLIAVYHGPAYIDKTMVRHPYPHKDIWIHCALAPDFNDLDYLEKLILLA